MIHVYLDDYRTCPKGFLHARSAEECLLLLQECEVDVLSFDYDLGWGKPNGMDVVRGIVASNRYPKRIYLHTSSDSGRQHMFQALYASKPEHVLVVNGPMPHALLEEIAQNVKE
ncbi:MULTISPECIES: cyclic-phosphate processing receiver domain-containing protein [unclassified Paenibacillus]|uniref:cyclic-phosphate processing receiver domain-containing protein n=1 Tax=unclassified Paenibacillus TaxID=185978 RepID=UPI0006D20A4C|nr:MULTISPECIES: cyclic-phosphate processing receiver domain-containing protein [unclassified Paenibacillus]